MYDTLMYVKKLEAVGIPRDQAEAQVEIMSQIVDSSFATKQDLKDLSAELRSEIRSEMGAIRLEMRDATIRHGKMLAAAVGIIIAAMGLMIKF